MPFPDTTEHWASEYIDDMVEDGWFYGYPDGTFRPDQPVTRAELATILWRKFHTPDPPVDPDTTPPVITLNGDPEIEILQGGIWNDPGATAHDAIDGDLPVAIFGLVDVGTPGDYTLEYRATDAAGNQAQAFRTVTVTPFVPPGGDDFDTIIAPGANAQQIVDAIGEGAIIGVAPGTHTAFSVQPRNGQTFSRVDPGVTVLAGDGRTNAFYSPNATAKFVTIRELEITGYTAGYQHGAIESHRAGTPSHLFEDGGWRIEGCNIHHNNGAGIYLSGNNVTVVGNVIADNGILGVLAKHGHAVLIADNEIARNNTSGANWGGEAGGTKFWNTRGMVVRNNHSHHNDGPGLWSDWNNAETIYEENTVNNNVGAPGIFHEIGGGCTVRNNHIFDNGWPDPDPNGMISKIRGAIHGAQPGTMTVYGNTIENCAKGITIVSQCRTTSLPYSEFDPWLSVLDAYANTIVDSNLSGRATDCGDMPTVTWADTNTMVGDNQLRL